MKNSSYKIEEICWNDPEAGNRIKCSAGFVTSESSSLLEITSTIGAGGYLDKNTVRKEFIISRRVLDDKK